MSDKEICQWIHDRMVGMWGENKNVDYMIRFRKAIDNIQDDPQAVTRLIAAVADFKRQYPNADVIPLSIIDTAFDAKE